MFFCLVAFFAVVAGVNAVMMRFAISTFGGVETASSYKAGLAFAQEMAAADAQQARHWRVSATIAPKGGGTHVAVSALNAAGEPLSGLAANLQFAHPTDRRLDQSFAMTPVAPGAFSATTAFVLAGQWDLVIEFDRDGERMFRSKSRVNLQ